MFNLGSADNLLAVASDDPLYNLRQVEQMLANSLSYNWFDVMSLYPFGSNIYWGPLFPLIIAICCIFTGAVTRPEIISISLLVPPFMAAIIVMIMYFVGKTCGDFKTGILASGFTAIISGIFFFRSFYGYIDHHIAEVLFSTIFCLFYMYALLSEKDRKIDFNDFNSFKQILFFSGFAGVVYLLGLFTMPTMILFAMIAGVFTVIQFIFDVFRGRTSEYLLIINCTIFSIGILGLTLFGFKNPGIDLSVYSIGHIYAYLGMIGGTTFLYFLSRHLKDKPKYFFLGAILGSAVLFAIVLYILTPQIFNQLILDFFSFFGQAPVTNTVQEARGWDLDLAWHSFNYGLFLMVGGILIMFYNNLHDEHPEQVFALIWSLIIFISTCQHIRYEYYLAVNIALLSAVCITFAMNKGGHSLYTLIKGVITHSSRGLSDSSEKNEHIAGKKQKKLRKKIEKQKQGTDFIPVIVFIGITILGVLFVYSCVSSSYNNSPAVPFHMNTDWKESLEWMRDNTPETGVDYITIYNPKTFQYPSGSYGVMSWWDYGHLITFIAKRIPNANPFQQGVAGDLGAAAYFVSDSEEHANSILDHLGTRYIITDIEMDSKKFEAMATWANSTLATSPYQITILRQSNDNPNILQSVVLNNQQYYLTMISRLHNFDGSMTPATDVYYIEYFDSTISGFSLPIIKQGTLMNATLAKQKAFAFNQAAPPGYHAEAMSPLYNTPIETVPALQHYRLVHESPTNVYNSNKIDVKYVKIFEYVKGAHIKGEGTIEVSVMTNTGRQIIYRQTSVNGEFIVPYSTSGSPYNVKTTGKYRIIGTNRQYDVPESGVMQGMTVP